MVSKSSISKSSDQAHRSESKVDLKGTSSNDLNLPDVNEEVVLEPLEINPYSVSYTCLLLPKSVTLELAGDITDFLEMTLKKVSVEYGWKLEFLSIKPDHLHWAIQVPPSTSTTQVVQIIRQQTSQRLFKDYPNLFEKQTDDFWAPGYLIFSGSHPHPDEVIQRYIRQTRKQQGIQVDE